MTVIAAMKTSNTIQHHLFSQSPSRLVLIPGSAGSFLIVWFFWFFIPFLIKILFLREHIRQFLHLIHSRVQTPSFSFAWTLS